MTTRLRIIVVALLAGLMSFITPAFANDANTPDDLLPGLMAVSRNSDGQGIPFLYSVEGLVWNRLANSPIQLRGIAGNADRWIAVGERGTVLSSTSNTEWIPMPSNTTQFLHHVTWSRQWVAVGNAGTIISSPNGVNWTIERTGIQEETLRGVAGNGSRWVVVGSGGIILTRDANSSLWARANSGTQSTLDAVAWGGNMWVAVGSGTILTSPNGTDWTSRGPVNAFLFSVAHNGSMWVAVGPFGGLYTSTNGINWTQRSLGQDNSAYSVVWLNNRWVVVGDRGLIATSPNGISWNIQRPTTSDLRGVAKQS